MTDASQRKAGFRFLLRAAGFHVFLHLAQFILQCLGFKLNLPAEPPKPVIRKSKAAGLARCVVHILPVLASSAIITLNICHLFLGETFPGIIHDIDISIALLQIAAKIQELLVLSSLATIVFHRVCDELMSDAGLPLGFLCSGFTFSQLGYYWSPDFWGAALAQFPRKRLLGLLIVAGLVAATAGPSAAVLMIPRDRPWDAGGSDFYLRGTVDQLFLKTLTASSLDAPSLCSGPDAVRRGFCPAGGFTALQNYVSQMPMINNGANLQDRLPARLFGVFSNQTIDLPGVTKGMPASKLVGSVRGVACQTAVIASFIPAVMYQQRLLSDWYTVVGNIPFGPTSMSTAEYRYCSRAPGPYAATSIRIPAVRTACSTAQNLRTGDLSVLFPVISESSCVDNSTKAYTVTQLEDSLPLANSRTSWIPLPAEFGAASVGLLFEGPWSMNDSSRPVIGCSVDVRWVNGTVERFEGIPKNLSDEEKWERSADLMTLFRPPADGSWDHITLHESWLQLLTPVAAPGSQNSPNQTTFDALLATSAIVDQNLTRAANRTAEWNFAAEGFPNRTIYLEWLTTLLVADGLSRYGSHRALNTSGAPTNWDLLDYAKTPDFDVQILGGHQALIPPPNTNFTTFRAKITIQGLSYQAHSPTDYLSMAVLLVHVILAAGHIFYILCYGQSSTAWDSITELVALTLNSRPPLAELPNTSAGIYCLKTFGKQFVIRSTPAVADTTSKDEAEETAEGPTRHVEFLLRDGTILMDSEDDEDNVAAVPNQGNNHTLQQRHILLPSLTWLLTVLRPRHQQDLDRTPGKRPASSSSSSSRKRTSAASSGIMPLPSGDNNGVMVEKIVPGHVYA